MVTLPAPPEKITVKYQDNKERGIMVIEVSDQNFEQEVLKSDLPVVVDFWAPWCGPCQRIGPVVDKLSEEFKGKLKFCKLNVDENPEAARNYQVMSIPLLLFFKEGKPMDQSLGAVSDSVIRSKAEALL
ncbi:thioredoxin [Chloroflexota bacterium]